MKDEILSYMEMCGREGMSLQRGMNFRSPPAHGIILMSRRPNALYEDEMSSDETVLLYEGHDVSRTRDTPDPKAHDQLRHNSNGRPTENGLLVQEGLEIPSNLQGLYECRYSGDELNMTAIMKLLKAFNEF